MHARAQLAQATARKRMLETRQDICTPQTLLIRGWQRTYTLRKLWQVPEIVLNCSSVTLCLHQQNVCETKNQLKVGKTFTVCLVVSQSCRSKYFDAHHTSRIHLPHTLLAHTTQSVCCEHIKMYHMNTAYDEYIKHTHEEKLHHTLSTLNRNRNRHSSCERLMEYIFSMETWCQTTSLPAPSKQNRKQKFSNVTKQR